MRKGYSKTLKQKAISLSKKIGAAKAAQELGISKQSIYFWKKQNAEKKYAPAPKNHLHPKPTVLKEQCEQLVRENEILREFCGKLMNFVRGVIPLSDVSDKGSSLKL